MALKGRFGEGTGASERNGQGTGGQKERQSPHPQLSLRASSSVSLVAADAGCKTGNVQQPPPPSYRYGVMPTIDQSISLFKSKLDNSKPGGLRIINR